MTRALITFNSYHDDNYHGRIDTTTNDWIIVERNNVFCPWIVKERGGACICQDLEIPYKGYPVKLNKTYQPYKGYYKDGFTMTVTELQNEP
jgi:hypothetical protein